MAKKKFYKKVKKESAQQLPSNYRRITDKLTSDGFAFLIGFAFIAVAIAFVSLDIFDNYQSHEREQADKNLVMSKINDWQKISTEKPNYRDAYFQLALLYYQINEFDKSSQNLQKALAIDPNFKQGRELEEILNSKK